ncbi:methylated-DNA--[protein]-cysteine S-methyltransferase [Anaerobacillus sp. HL2]|nr:methylated-DNA--[protein]-cysteine S-methyltransferase [Anaerobacillus sp. HL2]
MSLKLNYLLPRKVKPVITQLNQYFEGKRVAFDVPIDLIGTKFQCLVWDALTKISYGETKSYRKLQKKLVHQKSQFAPIGGANNRNPIPIIIPCHRVIGSNGALVGYGGG